MKIIVRLLLTIAALGSSAATLAQEQPVATVSQTELLSKMATPAADLLVLDVRTAEEFAAGHIPGAVNISHDQLAARLTELLDYKQREVIVYCRTGRRSEIAAGVLLAARFALVRHLAGDYTAWQAAERAIVIPK